MGDPVFPGQHTTTTTVTTSSTTVDVAIRFDKSYLDTLHGKLKVAEIFFSLVGFFIIAFSGKYALLDKSSFFALVSGIAFWWSLILLMFYLFHVIERFYRIPWMQIELLSCGILAAFYLLATILIFQYITLSFVFLVVIVCGIFATLSYAYDATVKYKAYQDGELAQGVRVVTKEVNQTNAPFRY